MDHRPSHMIITLNWTRIKVCDFVCVLGSDHWCWAEGERGSFHEPLLSAKLWDPEVDGERRHAGRTVRSRWRCRRYTASLRAENTVNCCNEVVYYIINVNNCFWNQILSIQFLNIRHTCSFHEINMIMWDTEENREAWNSHFKSNMVNKEKHQFKTTKWWILTRIIFESEIWKIFFLAYCVDILSSA